MKTFFAIKDPESNRILLESLGMAETAYEFQTMRSFLRKSMSPYTIPKQNIEENPEKPAGKRRIKFDSDTLNSLMKQNKSK